MSPFFHLLSTLILFSVTPGGAVSWQKMKHTVGKMKPPDNCYRSYRAPLDLVFVIDRTSKKVMNMAPKVVQIIELLVKDYPGSQFGISYYADFQCTDWHSESECKNLVAQKMEHDEPEGCYTFKSSLTEDTELIESLAGKMPLVGGQGKEAGINALFMTATDPKHHWGSKQQFDGHRNQIIFLITDKGTHCCSKLFGTSNPILGDGSDRCSTMTNPTPELTGKKLKEKGINVFLGLMKEGNGSSIDVFENWKAMTERMPILAAQSDFDKDDSKQIVEVFRHFMVLVVYKHGIVPCDLNEHVQLNY